MNFVAGMLPYIGSVVIGAAALIWFIDSRYFGPFDEAIGRLAERLL